MPPSASAMFPDNPGRFQSSHPCNLQRATHRPPRKNKQNQINNTHFQFNGILTVLVRRPCASSKHRLDKGGKPKVDASQMPPRCFQMLPRCFHQMLADASRCIPDASQMHPRCYKVPTNASQMSSCGFRLVSIWLPSGFLWFPVDSL